ncbi:antitoxin [Streptomyces roseirectus]|uniref:Antitoxin n=1 Tax=Streptomyces roseirectus TaxID=2768066 RepID=A0A7H0IPD2_9ACTN|nr:antitoxin [Streptomyces roseirectus]
MKGSVLQDCRGVQVFEGLKNLKELKEKVEGLAGEHGDKISAGLEKAGEFIDERTGGKHGDKIDTAVDKAQDYLGKLGEKKS